MTKVKKHIGSVFWNRGIRYFNNGYVSDIDFREDNESIEFTSEIEGSYDYYEVSLEIEKDFDQLNGYCTCYSFMDNNKCKHLGALALQIDKDYIINKDFSVISKKEDELKNRGLNILNQIGKIKSEKNNTNEEDNLFKIKLDFYPGSKDITMCLYQCKLLKNGNLSKGKKVYANALSSVPLKFQKLKSFIEYKQSNYYRNDKPDNMTFIDSPEIFINLLKGYSQIFDIDNKEVFLSKEAGQLKIKTVKNKDGNYNISLVLSLKTRDIDLKNTEFYGNSGDEIFAILTKDNHLLLGKTQLPTSFIESVEGDDIELTKEQFEDFKNGPFFENLLENTVNVEDMGIKCISGIPKNKFLIEIDKNFETVMVEYLFSYGEKSIPANDNFKTTIVDNKNVIKRDFDKERDLKKDLNNIFELFDEKENNTNVYIKYVDDNIDDFFDEVEKLIEFGVDIEYKQTTKRVTNKELGASVNIASGEDWFDANVEMKLGDNILEEASDIVFALKHGKNRITLKNGMTILLKEKLQNSFKELEELGINEKNVGETVKISKYNIGLLKDKKTKGDLIDFDLAKEVLKLKRSLTSFKGITKVKLSENIVADLRDYQVKGYEWLNFLSKYNFSGILADDMGLGKTLQTLAILQREYDKKILKTPSLIVCPTSLVLNWQDEAEKFTPNLKVEYIKNGKTGFDNINKDTQIIIVSYGMMANLVDKEDFKKKFYYLVLDEAQNIKNPVALRTKSICKIIAKYRLALSGTPIENNLMELWSIFNFLMPGFLGNLSAFKQKYITEEGNMRILSSKVKPFILRRTKEEVLKDLPPKVEEVIKLEMGDKQKAFYEKLKTTFRLQITKELEENGLNKARFQVLDSLLKLRQACLMPELVNMEGNKLTESIKIKYIEENIEDMIGKGHNLLIFSQFTGFLKYVKVVLDKRGINYNYLDGQVKKEDRKKLVDSFNSGDVNVFIISLKAGGTGLNLTSADYVIHLDPWWNPAVENQATDRAHRMGQEKTVFVQKLIIAGSIEEKILSLQEKKKKLIDDVFSGNFSGSLNENDIKFIFD